MKFHNHETMYELARRLQPELMRSISLDQFIGHVTSDLGGVERNCILMESLWYSRWREYFKVWPAIARGLANTSLDCKLSQLALQHRTICIRFAEGNEPRVSGERIKTILATRDTLKIDGVHKEAMSIAVTPLKKAGQHESEICAPLKAFGLDDLTFSEAIDEVSSNTDDGWECPQGTVAGLLSVGCKIALTVMLLANDPDLIRPEVLAADKEKFDKAAAAGDADTQNRLIDKAKRRGVVGWSIGEQYEMMPHVRRPHPALVWTEKGRTVPRIVMRKGSVVHRQKLTQVPTGYITPDGKEVEV